MTFSADTAELLRQYFILQRYLSLPGIGGFAMERIPAEVNGVSGHLSPPEYSARFEPAQSIPEKQLFSYLSRKKNISEWEAIGVVNSFAGFVKERLASGESFEWKGVGVLYKDPEGVDHFVPEIRRFSFFPELDAPAIWQEGGAEAHPDIKVVGREEEEIAEPVVEAETGWWVPVAIIAATALVLVFFSLVGNNYRFTSHRQTRFTTPATPEQYIFTPAQ